MPISWASHSVAELLALRQEQVGEVRGPGPGAAQGDHPAQARGVHPGEERVVLGRVERPGGGVGEPAVADAARRAGVAGRVTGEGDPQRGLAQRLAQLGDDLGGGVGEAVEDAQQAGADVLAGRAPRRRVVPGEPEQVVALVEREVQSLRDRGDHLLRGLRPALPLEARVVVGRHVAQRGDLLAPQPARPAALSARQADVLGLQRLAAPPQERRQPDPVDHRYRPLLGAPPFLPARAPRSHGPSIPLSGDGWPAQPRIGLAVAGVCAAVAAFSGEARAFFLLPTLIPAALGVFFLGSVLVRRPVTGMLFNRLVGGPADWRDHARLLRVYSITTLAGVGLHALNLVLRGVAYLADQPAVLAALGIAAAPMFAVLAAVTLVAARRAIATDPTPAVV